MLLIGSSVARLFIMAITFLSELDLIIFMKLSKDKTIFQPNNHFLQICFLSQSSKKVLGKSIHSFCKYFFICTIIIKSPHFRIFYFHFHCFCSFLEKDENFIWILTRRWHKNSTKMYSAEKNQASVVNKLKWNLQIGLMQTLIML